MEGSTSTREYPVVEHRGNRVFVPAGPGAHALPHDEGSARRRPLEIQCQPGHSTDTNHCLFPSRHGLRAIPRLTREMARHRTQFVEVREERRKLVESIGELFELCPDLLSAVDFTALNTGRHGVALKRVGGV